MRGKKGSGRRRTTSPSARSGSGGLAAGSLAENQVEELKLVASRWRRWFEADRRRTLLVAIGMSILMIFVMARFGGNGDSDDSKPTFGEDEVEFDAPDSVAATEEAAVAAKRKILTRGPSTEELQADLKAATGKTHPTEKPISAGDYNVLLRPMVGMPQWKSVICPDKGGGKQNKICSKAYTEYLFDVPSPGVYYVYVETIAPNINDNSLWIGAPNADPGRFMTCPSVKAGSLVPHKHVKSKRWLCCPKYLDNNAKKGQGAFYTQCCMTTLGPFAEDAGCILDLEVDSKPHWNMLPRELVVKSASEPVIIRLFAREDGTAVSRVMLSSNPTLKKIT